MKLIITRHGETEENAAGILQGHLPGVLSSTGIEQAKKLAQRLKEEKFDYIYSSDLDRAADTAKEICKYHPGTKIEFTKNLRERNLGELQGRRKSEVGWGGDDQQVTFIEPKGGETTEEVSKRAEDFLEKIINKHHNNSVLSVCHGGIGKALIGVITNKNYTEMQSSPNLQNTSVSIFEIDEDRNYRIICLNCIAHLK